MRVHQILKSKSDDSVVTVTPDSSVSEAAQMLASRKIGSVVVSPNGELAKGILSERDIVREIAQKGPGVLSHRVADHMTPDPHCCDREDEADAVLQRMTDGRFRHMPVVEAGRMIGLITLGDVVKARLAELSMEKDALEGMIMGH